MERSIFILGLVSLLILNTFTKVDSCSPPAPAPVPPGPPPSPPVTPTGPVTTVLWLGNSYTFYHDLPTMVNALTAVSGKSIHSESNLHGGWTWQQHAADPTSNSLIRKRKWDVVILQEQSQRPVFGENQVCAETVAPLKQLVSAIRANDPATEVQLFGTWGRPGANEFNQWQYWLTRRYKKFACLISAPARLAPVGEGFKKMEELHGLNARLALYDKNGGDHHSSVRGSYLAACIHYLAIHGKGTTVVGNPYHAGLDAGTAMQIQQVAEATWNDGVGWDYPDDESCTDTMC